MGGKNASLVKVTRESAPSKELCTQFSAKYARKEALSASIMEKVQEQVMIEEVNT